MLLLIAFPIGSVIIQSLHAQHEQVIEIVENCGPFGCTKEAAVNTEATQELRVAQPLGRFVGLDNYFNRGHLALSELAESWRISDSWGDYGNRIMNLPFYSACLLYTSPSPRDSR